LLLQVIRISNENGITVLNDFGIIAAACWLAIPEHFFARGADIKHKAPESLSTLRGFACFRVQAKHVSADCKIS
jgi:hypothetical protein